MHYVPYYDMNCHEYNSYQVRRILKEMGFYLEVIYIYKQRRTIHYNVRDIESDTVILHYVTMVWLRIVLTYLGFPPDYLSEPKYKRKKN